MGLLYFSSKQIASQTSGFSVVSYWIAKLNSSSRNMTEMLGLTAGYICHFGGVNSWQKAVHSFHSLSDPLRDLALCFSEAFTILQWIRSQNPMLWFTILLKATKSSFNDQVRLFTQDYYSKFKFSFLNACKQ